MVNVTALVTLDNTDVAPADGQLHASLKREVDRGLRQVLDLLAPRTAPRSSDSGAIPAPAIISPPRRRTFCLPVVLLRGRALEVSQQG